MSPYAHASERLSAQARAEAARRQHEDRLMQEELRSQFARQEQLADQRRQQHERSSQQQLASNPNAFDEALRGYYGAKHRGSDTAALLTLGGTGWV